MNLQTNFEVLDKINLPQQKKERINKIVDQISDTLGIQKTKIVKTVLENSERLITMKKSLESGMTSSDIDIFSNVLSVVVPKFWMNSILDRIVSVQPAKNPYPIIYYVDWIYADNYSEPEAMGGAGTTDVTGGTTPLSNVRTRRYGMVSELTQGRGVKATVRSKSLNTQIRRINAEWTLESIIALASVMGMENANTFVDERLTNTIYSKLKDEVEFDVLNSLWTNVPGANTQNFELNPAAFANDPVALEAYHKTISDVIEKLAAKIFREYGVKPNVLVVGPEAYALLDREKIQLVPGTGAFTGTLGRIFLGVFNLAYEIYYDPYMPGILMLCNYPENEIYSAVFAPYLIGNTPPITEKTANTYRIIYRCDAFDVVLPNTTAKIAFV